MGNNQIELDFERKHLKSTIEIAKRQLSNLMLKNKDKKTSIISSKKEAMEEYNHFISSNLWSMENFHELVELSQYATPLSNNISELEMEEKKIFLLEKLIKSPYFARIDFKFNDEDEFEKIYIGSTSLIDEKTHNIYVYDWRSPISSVFYRFGTGRVFYEAPSGKIRGEVSLKRQYEIKNGVLEYFFDADIQIIDEYLRRLLSQNASAKMKTIVETIQKEQDIIIRDMEIDLIMVQGVAGSGKTSVALHRVAYLMYQGLASRLYSNNIAIISPNTLFEQYISNVLPELGEKNVNTLKIEDIIRKVTNYENIQTRNDLLECLLSKDNGDDNIRKYSMEFKCSSQFAEILNRFIKDLPNKWIEFNDVYYNGKILFSRQFMKSKIIRDKNINLGLRLKKLEEHILDVIHDQRKLRIKKFKDFVCRNKKHSFEEEETARLLSIYESTVLIKSIRKFTQLNIFELYSNLFSDKKYFKNLAKGLDLPDCIDDIIDFTFNELQAKYLNYDDALAITFLYLKIRGISYFNDIKHVVIDEAQDYYMLHYEIFKLLFPKSRLTILGDINQTIGKQEDLSLYEEISTIFNRNRSTLITMDKSYRCTNEILMYSTKFLSEDLSGTFIIPIYLSKGLEFDSVMICDVDNDNYYADDDKKLLYIASTRALHRLSLFYTGKISKFLLNSSEQKGENNER